MGIIGNIRSRGLKDILSWEKVKVFFQSKKEEVEGITIRKDQAVAFAENVVFRRIMCDDCVALGECRVCHCPTDDLMTTSTAVCSDGKFLAMDLDNWEETKDKIMHGLEFGFVKKK